MTVHDLKEKLPLDAAYELKDDCKYLFVVDPNIIDIDTLPEIFNQLSLKAAVAVVSYSINGVNGIRVYEFIKPD
jgi:hypothetical protein